jgi:cell division protein FtsB
MSTMVARLERRLVQLVEKNARLRAEVATLTEELDYVRLRLKHCQDAYVVIAREPHEHDDRGRPE